MSFSPGELLLGLYLTVLLCLPQSSCAYIAKVVVEDKSSQSIVGRTPCCHDRLLQVACTRLQLAAPNNFNSRCVNDVDFGLVQCCSTCFTTAHQNSTIRYDFMVRSKLLAPKSDCYDRRGAKWCNLFARREGFWREDSYAQLSCATFAFAFRECRLSCGYCTPNKFTRRAGVVYDHKRANDPELCGVHNYFAREKLRTTTSIAATTTSEFDPLAHLQISEDRSNDYFVVSDYVIY